jgi:hypothetical protein
VRKASPSALTAAITHFIRMLRSIDIILRCTRRA